MTVPPTPQEAEIAGVAELARGLTKSMPKALAALSADCWQTASEVRSKTSPASLDILYIMNHDRLCDRRWTRWGGEQGQKRGEGYEYKLTELGAAVRAHLQRAQGER